MAAEDLPALMPILSVEMPWLFPKLDLQLFEAEVGGNSSSKTWPRSSTGFMLLVLEDPRAAGRLLHRMGEEALGLSEGSPSAQPIETSPYHEFIQALCSEPLSVGTLEVMHSQVSCRALSLSAAAQFVSHAILCLDEELEGPAVQQPRLGRLFSALLLKLLPAQPGLLVSCPELEPYCVRNLRNNEGVVLFQFLKQLQDLYL